MGENGTEVILSIIAMGLVIFIIAVFGIWGLLSVIPSINYHKHTEVCYDEENYLICGKEDNELFLSKSKVKDPLTFMSEMEDAYYVKHQSMTVEQRLLEDIPTFIILGIILISFIILEIKGKTKVSDNEVS